jgi:hypothetical protein
MQLIASRLMAVLPISRIVSHFTPAHPKGHPFIYGSTISLATQRLVMQSAVNQTPNITKP